MVFFNVLYIGSHVSLKLLLDLKTTGLCVPGCWLTIYSAQTSSILMAAESAA
jgi:hypothetical protein